MSGKFVDVTLRLIDKMTSPLNSAGANLKNSARQWERAGKQIQNAGKSITAVGASITTAVTVPIVGAGVAAIKVAADFEEGMSGVQAICGATGEELQALSEKAQEMGKHTKFSATEATDAFKYMAMAGWDVSEMTAGIEGIMYLAGATGEDLAQTSDIVTDALTAFGLTADDTSMFVDVLAQAANRSNTDVSTMGESFKYAATVAGAMKYSVQDVSVALGLMANNGVKGSTAGTSLRSWITRMAAPTKAVSTAMSELGLSLEDSEGKTKDFATVMQETRDAFAGLTESQKSQYASTLAGKSGMAGLLAIVNSSDKDFADLSSAIYDANGACKQMYDIAQNNLTGAITQLKSTVESIGISFGNKLVPYIKKGTEWLQNMADKFDALTDAQQDTIIKVALVAAAVGPAVLVFGKVVTTIGKVVSVVGKVGKAFRTFGSIAGMISSPVGITIGVLVSLIAVGVLLYKNWDKIKEKAGNVFNFVKQKLSSTGLSMDGIKKKFAPIGDKLREIRENIKTLWNAASPHLKKFGNAVASAFTSRAGVAIQAFGVLLKGTITVVAYVANGIMTRLSGLITFITGVFTGDWSKAWEGVKEIFGGAFDALVSLAKTPLNAVINAINGVISGINGMGITIPDWVPKLGGKSFTLNIPTIPQLATGTTNWKGGLAQVHERGGEIIDLPSGSRVYPHDKSVQMAYSAGASSRWSFNLDKLADQIVIREEGDIKKIVTQLADMLEKASENLGGDIDGNIPVLE